MSRELDRQIAINFHPNCLVRKTLEDNGRDRGFVGNMLAWDSNLVVAYGWTHCKDNIWATENLPHYSEDLNLAIKLSVVDGHKFQFQLDKEGDTGEYDVFFIKDAEYNVWAHSTFPAEAICLARLKLKEEYGV